MAFAEFCCRSNFSFLQGASHPEELVERAAGLGYRALALTDECSMAGIVRAYQAARKVALHLIVGTRLRLVIALATERSNSRVLEVVLLALNRNGYGHLCALISQGRLAAAKGDYGLSVAALADGLTDCAVLWLPGQEIQSGRIELDYGVDQWGQWLSHRFPSNSRRVGLGRQYP